MSYDFKNDQQRKAAKYILARSALKPSPNKRQLAKLIESKGDYSTTDSARDFVRNFVGHDSTPLENKGFDVVRTDIEPVAEKKEVGF